MLMQLLSHVVAGLCKTILNAGNEEGSAVVQTWSHTFTNCSKTPNESYCNCIFSDSILPIRPPLQFQTIASYFVSHVKIILLIIILDTKYTIYNGMFLGTLYLHSLSIISRYTPYYYNQNRTYTWHWRHVTLVELILCYLLHEL